MGNNLAQTSRISQLVHLIMIIFTKRKGVATFIVLLLMLLSCSSVKMLTPTLAPSPTSTPSVISTPKLTLSPTLSNTLTLTPSLTASESPVPEAYRTLNVNEHGFYTVYWKRVLWENALTADVVTEDFELDGTNYSELSFPYLTGHGFILDGGKISAQILRDVSLLPSGNLLLFRSSGSGLRFVFPEDAKANAFGFDYQASEEWRLIIADIVITIPEGRKGFIGIVFHGDDPSQFTLMSLNKVQGGLAVDNISYVRSTLP